MKTRWITVVVVVFVAVVSFTAYRAIRTAMEDNTVTVTSHVDADAASPSYAGRLRFLALGDSYTIGEEVKPAERWPVQLAAALRESRLDMSDPLIIAKTGWTTQDLITAMDAAKVETNYDLVTLLIGVNNQYQHRTVEEFDQQFAELLKRSITAARNDPKHVLVLSIPDWGATPFAHSGDTKSIGSEIDAFNKVARKQCDAAQVRWVDVTPLSRTASTQPDYIAGDGLHPSGAQYEKWVEIAMPTAEATLNVRR